jgi:hypothetical protein
VSEWTREVFESEHRERSNGSERLVAPVGE